MGTVSRGSIDCRLRARSTTRSTYLRIYPLDQSYKGPSAPRYGPHAGWRDGKTGERFAITGADKLSLNEGRRIWRPFFYAPDRRMHCCTLSNLPPPDWTDVTVRACMHTKPGNAAAHTRTGFQACLSANAGIPPAPLLEAHHGERQFTQCQTS